MLPLFLLHRTIASADVTTIHSAFSGSASSMDTFTLGPNALLSSLAAGSLQGLSVFTSLTITGNSQLDLATGSLSGIATPKLTV